MRKSLRKNGYKPIMTGLDKIIKLYPYAGLVALIFLLNGCGQAGGPTLGAVPREETVALPTRGPTPEPSPVSTRVVPLEIFTPGPTPTITPIPDEVRALVVEVIDGDTITVVMEGDSTSRAYQVRYLGIDAPPNDPTEPWGIVAYETNRRLTNLKVVRLVRDQSDADEEGRLLRYVYVDNQLLSIILTEQGLAEANIISPDTRFETEILEAEARAQAGNLGLWGGLPTPTPGQAEPAPTEEAGQTITPRATGTTPPVTGTVTLEPEVTATTSTPAPTDEETTPAATATRSSDETEATIEPTEEDDASQELQGPQ